MKDCYDILYFSMIL